MGILDLRIAITFSFQALFEVDLMESRGFDDDIVIKECKNASMRSNAAF